LSGYVYDPENENCWPELHDVIALFLQSGCERKPESWAHHESLDTARDRAYRIGNPLFKRAFITILGMVEHEFVAPDVIDGWERRLFTRIPKPWMNEPPRRSV
jgi:hypothetical protein